MQLIEIVCKPLKWTVVLAALLSSLLPAGCDRRQQSPPPRPVPEVSTVTVETQKIMLATELPGRTSAYRIAEIRPQVSGLIQKRLFTEGSEVKAGQVLYQIDPAPFQAALDNAMAALKRSEANLPAIRLRVERFRDVLADHAVSQQDYDEAAAALKQAEADTQSWEATVKLARINLGYTRITAPISGRIGISSVTDGAIVTAYQPIPLASIQQLDPIYVDVPQATTELLRLQQSLKDGRLNQSGSNQNKVKLILEDGTAYPQEGTLQFSDVTVDPTTGSVILRVVFPNPDCTLLPGMFVRALVKEGVKEEAVLIPQQAVTRDQKGNPIALTVNAEGKVEQRMLTLDRAIGNQWLVDSGLQVGDSVIAEGMQRVCPGAAVKVIPFDADRKESAEPPNTARPAQESN
jgi:membrane fusion protein (multidrug efflux system)